MTAGFYYKTFMWPKSFWHKVYEPNIRAAAGLGRAPESEDPERYANRYLHVDVLVAGGGPAGLAAALAAGQTGASVLIADENLSFGGWLKVERHTTIDGVPAMEWVADAVARLQAMANVRVMPRTTVFGYHNHNMLSLAEQLTEHLANPDPALPRERLWQVRARKVVLATGSIERPLVFPDNDRPGIMLAGAGRLYLNQYGVTPGRRVAVFTAHDAAYAAAIDLAEAGVDVPVLVDLRADPDPALMRAAREAGIEVLAGYGVRTVAGTRRITGFMVEDLRTGQDNRSFACDALLMSAGFTPSVHLFSQSRGTLAFDAGLYSYVPGKAVQACESVGACAGQFDLAVAIAEASRAGTQAGGNETTEAASPAVTHASAHSGGMAGATPAAGPGTSVKAFVDYQNDVTARDIRLAIAEGFTSVEHIKRFTTNGMATDQGKLSNIHGIGVAAEALARPMPDVGLTTFRAPFTPVTFGTIAGHGRGELFDPTRKTPIHSSAEADGAAFEDVSQWKRAWYFGRGGDIHAAVARECRVVREAGGLFDATTLGKIEVTGRDAAKFLDLVYATPFASLAVGKCRYGLMLNEAGFIIDDGIVARVEENRYHVTTTTGGAPRVLNQMEDYRQTEFPELDVWLTSITEQWAVIAVQGPKARDLIAPHVDGVDLQNAAFPHMSVATCRFMGLPCRLFRVSFTGELGYEINVPADYGRAVWDALREEGRPLGIEPYGTETMHVLRAEKGYIIVGQETDGTVTPADAGMAWAVSKKKADFVGKRGLERPDLSAKGRKQLVGLRTLNPADRPGGGCPDRRRSAGTGADDDDRPRHLVLSFGDARPFDRPGTGQGRPRADGADAACAHAGRRYRRRGGRPGLRRPGQRAAQWLRDRTWQRPPPTAQGTRRPAVRPVRQPDATRRNDTRPSPRRLSPLDGHYATGPGVVLTPLPPRERISLRATPDAFGAVAEALGFDLPQKAKTSAVSSSFDVAADAGSGASFAAGDPVGQTRAALWLGPDEWLVLGPDASTDDELSMLSPLAALDGVSAVDVSHRSLALRVEGRAAEAVIAAGCPQDLRLDRFPVGACSRTVLTKVEIVLWRTGEVRFEIECWRSFADYVWAFLEDAARAPAV